MASIPNPEPSKPADKKPAPAKPAPTKASQRNRLPIIITFVSFLIICGYVAFSSHYRHSDFSGNSDQVIGLLIQQNKQIQASLASMSAEIETLKQDAVENRKSVPNVNSQGSSDEYREAFNSELDLLRLSYKKLLKERDVMQQQIDELRKQLKFVQTTELMELKNQHQREVEILRGEILYVKKEVLLIIQDLAGNLFDEKKKRKFNEDMFSSENKEDLKTKSKEWIENAYQSFTSFVTESIPKATSDLGDTAKSGLEKVKAYVDETVPKVAETIKDATQMTVEKVKDVGQQVGDSAKEGIKQAKSGFETVKTYVDETAPKVAETIKVSAQKTVEKMKDVGQQVGESAKEGIKIAGDFINENAPEVEKLGKAAKETLENVKDFVGENVPKMATKIGETAKQGMEKVKDFVGENAPEVIHKIEETAKESFETVKDYVGKTAPKVADKVEAAAKEAFEGLKNVGGKAKETGEMIADQAKKLSESVLNFWKK